MVMAGCEVVELPPGPTAGGVSDFLATRVRGSNGRGARRLRAIPMPPFPGGLGGDAAPVRSARMK